MDLSLLRPWLEAKRPSNERGDGPLIALIVFAVICVIVIGALLLTAPPQHR